MSVVATTERLELREFSADDAEGMYRLNSDAEVMRYDGDEPFSDVEEAKALLTGYGNYARDGFGRWSVYRRDTGEYIGWCGLNYSPERGEVDISYRFLRYSWNQGYATEAAEKSLELAFERFGLNRIVGRAMADNAASHRVLTKLGMSHTLEFTRDGADWVQYEITAEQWRAQRSQ